MYHYCFVVMNKKDIVNSPKFKYIILKWLFKIIAKYSEIPKSI